MISPSEKKRLVDGAFRVGGIGLWGMKRGRAWRPALPAAEWGEGVSRNEVALLFAELRALVFRGCGVRVCLSDDKSLPIDEYAVTSA